MSRKRVYVESSVISYLTARPSRVLSKLVKQQQTWDWWERRDQWELFVSTAVMLEIKNGDPAAAFRRVEAAEGLPLLPETDETRKIARYLIEAGAVPEKAVEDALHIAIAAMNGMDYLVTWNQTHIFNPDTLEKVYQAIRSAGYAPAVLVRPDNLLEKSDDA